MVQSVHLAFLALELHICQVLAAEMGTLADSSREISQGQRAPRKIGRLREKEARGFEIRLQLDGGEIEGSEGDLDTRYADEC